MHANAIHEIHVELLKRELSHVAEASNVWRIYCELKAQALDCVMQFITDYVSMDHCDVSKKIGEIVFRDRLFELFLDVTARAITNQISQRDVDVD